MSRVTTHAVIRWLTRVRGVSETLMRKRAGAGASECRIAVAGCEALGLSLAAAEREILPPHLAPALELGARTIQQNGFTLICRDKMVMTVVEGRYVAKLGVKQGNGRHRLALPRRERARPFDLSEHLTDVDP